MQNQEKHPTQAKSFPSIMIDDLAVYYSYTPEEPDTWTVQGSGASAYIQDVTMRVENKEVSVYDLMGLWSDGNWEEKAIEQILEEHE